MKNKLRKISIEGTAFLYKIQTKYESHVHNLMLKIFKKDCPVPLVINFSTWDDLILGHPLKTGFELRNRETLKMENINLHKPSIVRLLILKGIKSGWNGQKDIGIQNGIEWLDAVGYEAKVLSPNSN